MYLVLYTSDTHILTWNKAFVSGLSPLDSLQRGQRPLLQRENNVFT